MAWVVAALAIAACVTGCGGGRGDGRGGPRDGGRRADGGPGSDGGPGVDGGPGLDGGPVCPTGFTDCGGAAGCVDITRDPAHCGLCGRSCAVGETCSGGTCRTGGCALPEVDCGGVCTDTDFDVANCGSCGWRCAASERCNFGTCESTCAFPREICAGLCVDTSSDETNCGLCGRRCVAGETCVDGFCEPPAGSCDVGVACSADRGCRTGECIPEFPTTIGEPTDAIRGEPGGRTEIDVTYWLGGYCVPALPALGAEMACDLADPGGCPACSTCTDLGAGQSMCMQACTPAATGLGGCRTGYTCDFGTEVCYPGCTGTDECHIYREDTNGDGTIEAPAAGATAVDRLVWDPAAGISCDATTGRCTHGDGGGRAGDACVRSTQCEADGLCIAGWPGGGYCTRLGCDIAGRSCAGAGVCQERRIGLAICGEGCTVGAESAMPALRLGVSGHAVGCRTGYSCAWNGIDPSGVNGICIPGNYNAVVTNDVGAACSDDADCYSPFGGGACIFAPTGSCSILDCGAPGLPTDVCGTGNVCAGGFPDSLSICLRSCTGAATCAPGHDCVDAATAGLTGVTGSVCFPAM